MLKTLPNLQTTVSVWQCHILELPQCCPVSQNPQPGSKIYIYYRAKGYHLEVYALKNFIQSFVGGQRCPVTRKVEVREMEHMIQEITKQCANAVQTRVKVKAFLILDAGTMLVSCRAQL